MDYEFFLHSGRLVEETYWQKRETSSGRRVAGRYRWRIARRYILVEEEQEGWQVPVEEEEGGCQEPVEEEEEEGGWQLWVEGGWQVGATRARTRLQHHVTIAKIFFVPCRRE